MTVGITPLAAHLEVGDIGDPDPIGAFDRDRMRPAFHAGAEPGQARRLQIRAERREPRVRASIARPDAGSRFPRVGAGARVDARTP